MHCPEGLKKVEKFHFCGWTSVLVGSFRKSKFETSLQALFKPTFIGVDFTRSHVVHHELQRRLGDALWFLVTSHYNILKEKKNWYHYVVITLFGRRMPARIGLGKIFKGIMVYISTYSFHNYLHKFVKLFDILCQRFTGLLYLLACFTRKFCWRHTCWLNAQEKT